MSDALPIVSAPPSLRRGVSAADGVVVLSHIPPVGANCVRPPSLHHVSAGEQCSPLQSSTPFVRPSPFPVIPRVAQRSRVYLIISCTLYPRASNARPSKFVRQCTDILRPFLPPLPKGGCRHRRRGDSTRSTPRLLPRTPPRCAAARRSRRPAFSFPVPASPPPALCAAPALG